METFYLDLIGYEHKANVNMLQKELEQSIINNQPFSIKRICDLLPISSSNLSGLIARGEIIFNSGEAKNSGTPLRVDFTDTALGKFFVNISQNVSAKYISTSNSLQFIFDSSKILIEMQKIADGGGARSKFQIINSFAFADDRFTFILSDNANNEKLTEVTVSLNPEISHLMRIGGSLVNRNIISESQILTVNPEFLKAALFSFDFCCDCGGTPGGGGGDNKWHIVRKKDQPTTCTTKFSNINISLDFEIVCEGPYDTEAEASAAMLTCPSCEF